MYSNNPAGPNFMYKRALASANFTSVKAGKSMIVEVMTSDEEGQLWKSVMYTTTPTGLQNCSFLCCWQDVLPPRKSGTARITTVTVETKYVCLL